MAVWVEDMGRLMPLSMAAAHYRKAVDLSIQCGNTTAAYIYSRMSARLALDNVLMRPHECDGNDCWCQRGSPYATS